ncbi:hypothetical protein, partial [Paramylibacter ulvae]|uniref:hypothetical protein n=1 Tax=Paramylibacter ulvae TaxID=1651968 RepID=UPI001E2D77DF
MAVGGKGEFIVMLPYITFFGLHGLVALMKRQSRATLFCFVLLNMYFVGFRYELGFDWPLYKQEFEFLKTLGFVEFFTSMPTIQVKYPHEFGFLIFAFISSKVFFIYELMQA